MNLLFVWGWCYFIPQCFLLKAQCWEIEGGKSSKGLYYWHTNPEREGSVKVHGRLLLPKRWTKHMKLRNLLIVIYSIVEGKTDYYIVPFFSEHLKVGPAVAPLILSLQQNLMCFLFLILFCFCLLDFYTILPKGNFRQQPCSICIAINIVTCDILSPKHIQIFLVRLSGPWRMLTWFQIYFPLLEWAYINSQSFTTFKGHLAIFLVNNLFNVV